MRIRDPLIIMASVLLVLAVGLLIATSWTASDNEASLWAVLGVAVAVGGGILAVGWRWALAILLWLITGVSVLLATLLFLMEGEFFVGCGDDICEGGIPGALGATAVAIFSLVLGWLVRSRSEGSRGVNRPLALGALGTFWLGIALIAIERERWLEETLVGDALLPVGLAMVGAAMLMGTISLRRRPATPRVRLSRGPEEPPVGALTASERDSRARNSHRTGSSQMA